MAKKTRKTAALEAADELIREAINKAFGRSRYVQETPILPDVWTRYLDLGDDENAPDNQRAFRPIDRRADLLLTSAAGSEPGKIAYALRDGLIRMGSDLDAARIAHNRTTVAAELTFSELVSVVVPMTQWWGELPEDLRNFNRIRSLSESTRFRSSAEVEFFTFAVTAGLLSRLLDKSRADTAELAAEVIAAREVTPRLLPLLEEFRSLVRNFEYSIAPINAAIGRAQLNRSGYLGVFNSRQTVKADACQNLFRGTAEKIKWAVIDCGIDALHPAFSAWATGVADPPLSSRITQTYDFTKVRDLMCGRTTIDVVGRPLHPGLISTLRERDDEGLQVDWSLIKEAITIPHRAALYHPPTEDHGTHVAGIIGANWDKDPNDKPIVGICPDIKLVDIRVFNGNTADEFNVIAALQFIGYLNRVSEVPEIHGVNISFSFAHDVRNYACGRTPICMECEKLVDSGVVVVTAAGNAGYSQAGTAPSLDDRYTIMSITDPGNAPSVITVGSTHRTQPHTYGVSFFSSRGPTGDGRPKPDLIAPGEKILSTTPNGQSGEKDGTSMAAPHVSGAAAILLARNAELIGQPRVVKDILCRSATDLGRERSFQGAGLLDVLRALQSV